MDANLLVGPVIHGSPSQPVPFFQPTEHPLDLLLAGVTRQDLLGGPVHAIGQQRSTTQTMRQQLFQSSMIEIKLQMPAAIALLQLIPHQVGDEGFR